MSKTYDLISTFYTNLSNDVSGYLTDSEALCFRISCEAIAYKCKVAPAETIRNLTLLGKAFERAIISGSAFRVPESCSESLSLDGTQLPSLFHETFLWFFRTNGDSRVRLTYLAVSEPSWHSMEIRASADLAQRFRILRQALLAFSKASDLECAAREQDEVAAFVRRMTRGYDPVNVHGFQYTHHEFIRGVLPIARTLLHEVLCDGSELCAELAQWQEDPYGRHGPGSVAGGEKANEKWRLREDNRIAKKLFCNHEPLSTCKSDEGVVAYVSRLAIVPKDATKHRLICIEPKELMFAQQGLMTVLYDVISRHVLTRDAIHLFDQSHNFYASRDAGCATLDLRDASDLLTSRLCRLLFPRKFLNLVNRYRSAAIELPDGQLIEDYEAQATMGNALCFPLESLAFWSLSLATILYSEVECMTYDSIRAVKWLIHNNPLLFERRYHLRVFGDDIIIPSHYFRYLSDILEIAGLSVNTDKSCDHSTPVRESCGSYWWGDFDVRVVKFSQANADTPTQFVGALTQLSQLREYGLTETANAMSRVLESLQPFFDPERHTIPSAVKSGLVRFNPVLQRLEHRSLTLQEDGTSVDLPGDVGLYAYFTDSATRALGHSSTQCAKWSWVPICFDKNK